MVTVKCKSCNENFTIEDNQDIIICYYCKTRWKVERSDFGKIVNIDKYAKITRKLKILPRHCPPHTTCDEDNTYTEDSGENLIDLGIISLWTILYSFLVMVVLPAIFPVLNEPESYGKCCRDFLVGSILLSMIIPILAIIFGRRELRWRKYLKKQKLKRQAEINGEKEKELTDKSQE